MTGEESLGGDVSAAGLYAVEKAADDVADKTVGKQATYIHDLEEAPFKGFPRLPFSRRLLDWLCGFWTSTWHMWGLVLGNLGSPWGH